MVFLYGAVVGLAIREAFARVGPDLVQFLSTDAALWKIHLEALRLIIFFFAISTFYIGSIVFFDKVHLCEEAQQSYPKSNYGYDFWFGLVHFVIFFFCAITINDFSRTKAGLSLFVIYLSFICLYDLLWLYVNRKQDSFEEIKVWAWSSAVVVFLAGVAFLVTKKIFEKDDVIAEYASLTFFAAYLWIDLAELLTGNQIISKWMLKLLPKSALATVQNSGTGVPAGVQVPAGKEAPNPPKP
jgi:hypothetical protein